MPSDFFSKNKDERNLEIAIYRIGKYTHTFIKLVNLTPEMEEHIKKEFSNNNKLDKMIDDYVSEIFGE